MGASGIPWVDAVFDWCVTLLIVISDIFGISYEEVNLWIFCVIWPALTIYQTLRILYLKSNRCA